jgi:membrane associated rhomboid family serine protease
MLPLTDTIRPRRFPVVTVSLIAANVAVWLLYQVPVGIESSVEEAGAYACALDASCDLGLPWPVAALTATFTHGGWSHLIGNMIFLGVFGPRVEDDMSRLGYLALYLVAGYGAALLFDAATLAFLPADEATIPSIGASGAISGVVGAYVVRHPFDRVVVWAAPILFLRIPAIAALGVWFVLQALAGTYTLGHPEGLVGIAFLAHVGGFLVGAGVQLVRGRGFGGSRPDEPLTTS